VDSEGRVAQLAELRQRIFDGGCSATLRKETWPILLDVFPHSLTRKQRTDLIIQKVFSFSRHTFWLELISTQTYFRQRCAIAITNAYSKLNYSENLIGNW
jgi:hypothetical protein